ncbi:MAG: cupin domain-containing protein [Saprospiraceae bacterium]|nr:cupin domain-containing protein [Saprospiraceae bacterium]MCZ2338179.1 cupin domain-containing protein [Chitinophagales bacterium]
MENKSNSSTPLRPEGDRILNAPLVEMDLNRFIDQIKSESAWKEGDHNSITIFKSDAMRIVVIGLHKGAILKTHKTNSNISVQVLQGAISFSTAEQSVDLNPGQMVTLHARIPHSVLAREESFFLLTFATTA